MGKGALPKGLSCHEEALRLNGRKDKGFVLIFQVKNKMDNFVAQVGLTQNSL